MARRLLSTACAMLMAHAAAGATAAGDSTPPTDYTVEPVVDPQEKDNGPNRIVSLAPSLTELCASLGMADRVVGRTQFCTHPPSVAEATVVGGYVDTNYEQILALQPDVVLVTERSQKQVAMLKQLDIHFVALPDNSIQDIYAAIEKLGVACARPRSASMLIQRLKQDMARLSASAPNHDVTVLITLNPLPSRPGPIYVAGPGSHLDDLLHMAGYRNALAGHTTESWAKISVEMLISVAPDIILEARSDQPRRRVSGQRSEWAVLNQVAAIRDNQILALHHSAAVKPGPRINIALYDMISVLSG